MYLDVLVLERARVRLSGCTWQGCGSSDQCVVLYRRSVPSVYLEIVNPGLMDTDGWANKKRKKKKHLCVYGSWSIISSITRMGMELVNKQSVFQCVRCIRQLCTVGQSEINSKVDRISQCKTFRSCKMASWIATLASLEAKQGWSCSILGWETSQCQ